MFPISVHCTVARMSSLRKVRNLVLELKELVPKRFEKFVMVLISSSYAIVISRIQTNKRNLQNPFLLSKF